MKHLKKHPKQQRMEDITFPLHKDKVVWEGREWLRSINDPNHERKMVGVMLLVLALIYAVAVYVLV